MRAFGEGGNSAYTNSASAQTDDLPADDPPADDPPADDPTSTPGVPASPRPVDGATNVRAPAKLSWDESPGANRYDLYFGTSPNPPLYRANLVKNQRTVSRLQRSQTYYWRIVATNNTGATSGPTWQFTARP